MRQRERINVCTSGRCEIQAETRQGPSEGLSRISQSQSGAHNFQEVLHSPDLQPELIRGDQSSAARTTANGELALDQCAERQGPPIPALSPGEEGRAAARSHAAEPSTLPLSHPVGDSCGANELGDATPPCHGGRTASNSVSVVGGGRESQRRSALECQIRVNNPSNYFTGFGS
ncbi:unnamed protein product [Pleuronectes platessa]|uniref:Uncharacterized protein n=1 Tax=Pleuronectes platessa TaxID=8262 RepID=A0A9N7VUB6_PLEPL|nr:unnamed protein product [Pleuronectes platessa]